MRLGLLFILAFVTGLIVPGLASGYGNGGNGGSGAGAELHEHASGGVSWIPNPNGKDIIGSSVWHGPRPAGPFEEDTSIQDALDALARGKGSTYSDEDVRKNMEWAKRAGVLRGIKIPPELIPYMEKAGPQTSSGQSSTVPSSHPTRIFSGRQGTAPPRQPSSTPSLSEIKKLYQEFKLSNPAEVTLLFALSHPGKYTKEELAAILILFIIVMKGHSP